jgi:hypothetical protein
VPVLSQERVRESFKSLKLAQKQEFKMRIQAKGSCAAVRVVLVKMIGQFKVGFPTKARLK